MPPKSSSRVFLYAGFVIGIISGVWVTLVTSEVIIGWYQLTARITAFPAFDAGSSYVSLANLATSSIFAFILRLVLGILTIIAGIVAMGREKKVGENTKGASFLIFLGIYVLVLTVLLFFVGIYFTFGALSNSGGL